MDNSQAEVAAAQAVVDAALAEGATEGWADLTEEQRAAAARASVATNPTEWYAD
jgi:hypothetical protein